MMLLEYFARLALLLPLLGGLIWGSLKLTRYLQTRMAGEMGGRGRDLELIETSLVAPGMKLAVVRFHDREILLGASRQGLVRLAEAPARSTAESGE
ncbi:MAG: flagellar biosynthetic protein FliO [Porphyrobacter sp.]|jgi:flagellar protein FliO/FliZ|nr:flagellar biosynthetic protein FliO [Porphyrobacter sp.]